MKTFLLMVFALLNIAALSAQAPQKFNYQAVPRQADGSLFDPNQTLKVRFQLHENMASGPVRYAEEQILTVSPHGVINAVVGTGSISGNLPHNFSAVDWSAHNYFLAVLLDANQNGAFEANENFGATQMLSVPYAMYAETSGSSLPGPQGPQGDPGPPGPPGPQGDGNINGLGTYGYISKFTGATGINGSSIYETGGKIGIGTTVPSEKLHIDGNLKVTDDLLLGTSGQLFYIGGALRFGNTLTPSTSDGGMNLGTSAYKWGTVWATNGVIQTSDARFKRDVTPLAYGLEEVMQMHPVRYFWKDEKMGRKAQLGFVAQELQTVLKEVVADEEYVVTDEKTGAGEWKPTATLGVAYSEIIPVLVAAVQEQQAQIEALQAQVNALKQPQPSFGE